MTLTKPTLTFNKKLSRTLDFIGRITCLELDGAEKFNAVNKRIAENTLKGCESHAEEFGNGRNGATVALLEPSVTYLDDDIISAKYDFTVTNNGELLFHRRFCISYLLKYELFLLPTFVKGLGRSSADGFYLTRLDGRVGAVRLKSTQMKSGVRLARRSQIDETVNGTVKPVKIKLPRYLERATSRKKK